MEESTLLLVMRHIASLPVRVPFPKAEVIEKARDKALVLGVAQGLGIPIPLTLFDGPPGKDSPFPLPALVKPRISSGARGIAVAADREGLDLAYHQVARRFPRPLVQERLPPQGEGIGVSLLLSPSGRLLASFTHRRLREYPVAGGASTLRESARLPIVEKQALALLEALGFRGLAMVEFKRDVRDGSYRLMEVNPRFWGSLALAVSAGVNFPSILVDSALDRPPEPPPAYRTGVRCRWLLPGDLLHFLANPSRFRIEPSFGKFFGPDLHYDILSREDPYPALARILSFLPLLGSKDLRRFLRR
jgi:predicted ATP-grasp superfamily ATP-dependent carboligase